MLYAFIVYIIVPYKTIKIKNALLYLLGGFLSIGLLLYFFETFPDWTNLANILTNGYVNPLDYLHIQNFVQIGLVEELAKLGSFFLIEKVRRSFSKVKDHPVATMFYVGMVSLGFAVIENISYGSFAVNPGDTLMWRSITAVIGHMVFGLFMGYWISLGRLGARLNNRSIVDILILKKEKLRRRLFIFIGLGAATILHGLYDLHLSIHGNAGISTLYMLLIMSVFGVFWCFKNINKVYQDKLGEKVDN